MAKASRPFTGLRSIQRRKERTVDNGERFETYVIRGPRGSGVCCLNGAAAHKGKVGDKLIVMAWAQVPEDDARAFQPKIGVLDENNRLK